MRFATSLILLSVVLSAPAYSAQLACEEAAKGFAEKDYIATMGAVQNPAGLEKLSQPVTSIPGEERFEVAIYDMSPEGDAWSFLYEVVLRVESQGSNCSLVNLENLEVSD